MPAMNLSRKKKLDLSKISTASCLNPLVENARPWFSALTQNAWLTNLDKLCLFMPPNGTEVVNPLSCQFQGRTSRRLNPSGCLPLMVLGYASASINCLQLSFHITPLGAYKKQANNVLYGTVIFRQSTVNRNFKSHETRFTESEIWLQKIWHGQLIAPCGLPHKVD